MSIAPSFKFIMPLFLIPLILVVIWFMNGLIMGGGEEGLTFYNPSKSLELSGTWEEYATGAHNFGSLPMTTLLYPISFLNEKFHIPNFILQAGTFFILLVVGTLSVYFLTLNLLSQHQFRHKVALVSSLFYLLNPFTISQIWGRSITAQYFAFALLPISILIFLIGLKKRKYIFTVFLTLVSIIFSTAFGFVTFLMTYWLVLALTFIYWVITSKQKKKGLLFGLFFFILSLFLFIVGHFWWLQGYIPVSNNIASERLGDPERNLGSLIGVSRNFTPDLVIRLLQKSYFSSEGYYGKIYVSLPFQLISLIPPIFVILGLIKVFKIIELKTFKFFVILFALGLFVSLGANPPLGWLFVWIFKNISFLQPFRNPYEKFGLIYVLGYAPLFALGIVYFFQLFQQRFKIWGLLTILILTCGIFAWPIWTGRIHAVLDKKIGIPVPSYYQDLSEFLDKNSEGYRVFMTPLWGGDSSSYLWEDKIYQGTDPSLYLLAQPTISNTLQGPYYYDFISNIRRYMERINLAPALTLLRTKYLVDRGDAIMIPEGDKLHYKFLTTAIQPPSDANAVNRSVCQNMDFISQDTSTAKIICQIPENEQDWRGIKYLHLEVKTDTPASLDIAIRDKKEIRNRWEGRKVSDYQIENGWTSITIPLNAPTEYNYQMDFSNIYLLEVLAYPKDSQRTNIGNITLREVKLDSGREVETNEFRLIKTFGKLKLYEPKSFTSPSEFGSLSQVNKVEDFVQLFQEVFQKRDSIDQEGFLILSQNPNKDSSSLSEDGGLKIVNKSKISETRYWIETDQNSEEGFVLLSKTFNLQWKVIPDVSENELEGSFGNDIRLLGKSFLPESNHYVVNGYANLWLVDGKNSRYAIVFMPQIMADIGAKVSIVGMLMMVGFTAIWVIVRLFQLYLKR